MSTELPFFISCPHSGEKLPPEANWLLGKNEVTLLRDVDRFVDLFYRPISKELDIPFIFSPWSRYVIDLNRFPGDIDKDSVKDSINPSGSHTSGLHWVKTSHDEVLMNTPISRELHDILVAAYFEPFHKSIQNHFDHYKHKGHKRVFHLDAHSMPSMGKQMHRDPGEKRKEIVISDQDGTSCDPKFRDLIVDAYKSAGFEVALNWPYKGGRITQTYGNPANGRHTIQVEMNRAIYMNEDTKELLVDEHKEVLDKIQKTIKTITTELESHVFLIK